MAKVVSPAKLGIEIVRTANAVRFASVDAINHTAFQCRKAAQKSLRDKFTLRNKWTERGILVEKATKQKEYAEVFSRDWYVAQREEGGNRVVPKKNTLGEAAFEIPTKSFFDLVQQVSQKKVIGKRFKPKGLLSTKVRGNKPFVLRGSQVRTRKTGKSIFSGVYVRDNSGQSAIRLLYGIKKKKQSIKKKSWFYKPVEISFDKNIEKNYNTAIKKALIR